VPEEPKDYQKEVEKLASIYPNIKKRVYKTAKRSWKEVYEKMLDIIEKEKWAPQPKTKTNL
jgi:glutathionyl-hydroquinone reductase